MSSAKTRQADCVRADQLTEQSFAESLDERAVEWLDSHRQCCSPCASAAQAVSGNGDVWESLDQLDVAECPADLSVKSTVIDHLRGLPVAALELTFKHRLGLGALSAGVVTFMLMALGLRGDLEMHSWTVMFLPVAVMLTGWTAALAGFDRAGRRRWGVLGLLLVGLVLAVFVYNSLSMHREPGGDLPAGMSLVAANLNCGMTGALVALMAMVPAVWLARRCMAGPTIMGAIFLGVMAGGLGVCVLQLHCYVGDLRHVLLGHGAVLLLMPVVALVTRGFRKLS